MRRHLLLVLFFFFISWVMAQKQPLSHKIPLSWTAETRLFSKSSDWEFFLGEDKEYIYLGMLIPPGKEAQQVLMTGMTVWFGKKAGHKKAVGLRFPLGLPKEELPGTPQELQSTLFNWQEKEKGLIKAFSQMELINAFGKQDTLLGPANQIGGVRTTFLQEGGYWVYELILPKNSLPEFLAEQKKLNMLVESGALGRPRDLKGTDAVGFVNSQLYRTGPGGRKERNRINQYFYYSDYTRPVSQKVKGIGISLEKNN